MFALLIVVLCLLVVVGLVLNGAFLWLSSKICRVTKPLPDGRLVGLQPLASRGPAAPGATKPLPDGRKVGVSFVRALVCATLILLIGNAIGVPAGLALTNLLPPSAEDTFLSWCLATVVLTVASIFLEVLFLRYALPTSFWRSISVWFLWTLFSGVGAAVLTVPLFFAIKQFVAEAFVIPTGAEAETILGYHKEVVCPQCGYAFAVNCSSQADPQNGPPSWVRGCTCPNCRQHIRFARPDTKYGDPPPNGVDSIGDPPWSGGDRVLIGKGFFGSHTIPPRRLDFTVFQYPGDGGRPPPSPPINYIKRLVGLPGETIAIHAGKLYILTPDKGLKYDDKEGATKEEEDRKQWMHADDPEALRRFDAGEFAILRKPPEVVLAMKRIVYDNDHPAKDLKDAPRWSGDKENGWTEEGGVFHAGAADPTRWLRYHHVLRGETKKPQLVTDFMGYNTWEPHQAPGENWVGDLILECEVAADKAEGDLTLELSRGPDRFRARFHLADGVCKLLCVNDGKEEELDSKPTALKGGAAHRIRFADVDQRLTVWVDDALPFGDGVAFTPTTDGPTENDLEPAGIAVQGSGATLQHIKLWRDTYYTTAHWMGNPSAADSGRANVDFGDPSTWGPLRKLPVRTWYVQPGQYFVLGDNSPESSDSRSWGLVPDRLLLGKAVLLYYPFDRFSWVH